MASRKPDLGKMRWTVLRRLNERTPEQRLICDVKSYPIADSIGYEMRDAMQRAYR